MYYILLSWVCVILSGWLGVYLCNAWWGALVGVAATWVLFQLLVRLFTLRVVGTLAALAMVALTLLIFLDWQHAYTLIPFHAIPRLQGRLWLLFLTSAVYSWWSLDVSAIHANMRGFLRLGQVGLELYDAGEMKPAITALELALRCALRIRRLLLRNPDFVHLFKEIIEALANACDASGEPAQAEKWRALSEQIVTGAAN